jgi:hypothetical protein
MGELPPETEKKLQEIDFAGEAYEMLLGLPTNKRTDRFKEVMHWLLEKFDPISGREAKAASWSEGGWAIREIEDR